VLILFFLSNVDSHFQHRSFLMFPSKSIHTDGIRAGIMSSFGFGQVGGVALVIHPRYLFGALDASTYEAYKGRNRLRAAQSYKAMSEMMIKNNLVRIKDHPPYSLEIEDSILLNSMARVTLDAKTGEYAFKAKQDSKPVLDVANVKLVSDVVASGALSTPDASGFVGVGVDQGQIPLATFVNHLTYIHTELITSVPSHNPTFVARNFTESEIAYCNSQPSPASSFAARWVGKEAIFKSLGVKSQGAGAAMKDIEILNDSNGVPTVTLHGEAKSQAAQKGVGKVLLSLSHSEVIRFHTNDFFTLLTSIYRLLLLHSLKLRSKRLNCCHTLLLDFL
jgi:fatty acid synthase subunit alpha, fungi type